jgi:hypothetical protein
MVEKKAWRKGSFQGDHNSFQNAAECWRRGPTAGSAQGREVKAHGLGEAACTFLTEALGRPCGEEGLQGRSAQGGLHKSDLTTFWQPRDKLGGREAWSKIPCHWESSASRVNR